MKKQVDYFTQLKLCRKTTQEIIIQIAELPKEYEDLLILRYVEDMSLCEIQQVLYHGGKELKSIANDITKARARFNNIINGEYDTFSRLEKRYINKVRSA